MTQEQELADIIVAAVKQATAALEQRIAGLEAALEQRTTLSYKGTWDAVTQYNPGEFVTTDGSMWHCNRSTRAKPGNGCSDWTLAVKHGRDLR